MTDDEAKKLGKLVRGADGDNMLTGSFAAELVGESYPFSTAMSAIVFQTYTDEDLGRKFRDYCGENDRKRRSPAHSE